MRMIFIIILLTFTGFKTTESADFFGLQVYDPQYTEDAFSITKTPEAFVYNYTPEYCDPTVYCYIDIFSTNIFIQIFNESKMPIFTNYLNDEYILVTNDDSIYMLNIPFTNKLNYRDDYNKVLNPHNRKSLRVTGFNDNKNEIKYIIAVLNNGNTTIIAKKIPIN